MREPLMETTSFNITISWYAPEVFLNWKDGHLNRCKSGVRFVVEERKGIHSGGFSPRQGCQRRYF